MTCFENFLTNEYETLRRYAEYVAGKTWGEDLLHDMSMTFLAKGEAIDKLCTRGEIMAYMKRAMRIASWHEDGKFYKHYKKYEKLRTQVDIEQMMLDDGMIIYREKKQLGMVFSILQEINWFDREIFKAYYLHSHSLNTFSDATGINRQTIYRSIRKAQAHIKAKAQEIERAGG